MPSTAIQAGQRGFKRDGASGIIHNWGSVMYITGHPSQNHQGASVRVSGPIVNLLNLNVRLGVGQHSSCKNSFEIQVTLQLNTACDWEKLSTQVLNVLPEVSLLVDGRARPRRNDSWHPFTHFYLKYPVVWSSKFSRQNNSFKHIIVLRKWIEILNACTKAKCLWFISLNH